jgi:RNA polymerase-binding transcription factor DksA
MALTQDERKHLEARLHEERERVLRVLRRSDETRSVTESERSGDVSNLPFHLADIGTETYEQEMDATLAQRASDELRSIDDALRRFYETPDRYGVDEETGEPIAFERLDLIPWARTNNRENGARGR